MEIPTCNGEIEKLYGKTFQVSMKEGSITSKRKGNILLTVESHSISIPVFRKELVVRITDDSDPFFLYTLNLSEDDFQSLKTQQGLLVDFPAFPQKFVELLELCLQEEKKEVPRFLLSLNVQGKLGIDPGPAQLDIIETNPFKHLTHLSLKLLPASDINVKKYLAKCLKLLKEEKERLESQLRVTDADLRHRLSSCQEALSSTAKELEQVKTDSKAEIAEIFRKHMNEMQTEKERLMKINHEDEESWNRERKDKELSHQKKVQHLESRINCLDSLNKELQEKQFKSDTISRELRGRLASLEDEIKQSHVKMQTLSNEKTTFETEYQEQKKMVNHLRSKVLSLEQDIGEKIQLTSRLQEQLKAAQEQKASAEYTLEKKQAILLKRESALKTLSEEIDKGNEIIRKLQAEMHSTHAKLKVRGKIALKQEEVLSEKDQCIQELQEDVTTTKEILKEKEKENKSLLEQIAELNKKLEEKDKQIKTDEGVIKWLNKNLTDSQTSSALRTTPTGEPSVNAALRQPGLMNVGISRPPVMSTGLYTSATRSPTILGSNQPLYTPQLSVPSVPISPSLSSVPSITQAYNPSAVTIAKSVSHPLLDPRYLQRDVPISSQAIHCTATIPTSSQGTYSLAPRIPVPLPKATNVLSATSVISSHLPRSHVLASNYARIRLPATSTSTPMQNS